MAMININLNSRTTDVVVIVVIVLVIAAMLFPILLPPPRSKSASSWCMFKLHTMGKAMHAYQDDWDGVFPDPSVAAVWGHGSRRTWTENLYHYHKDIEVYRCPTRKVNFAYAMNNRLGGDTPVMPTHCVFVYESPGCGNLNYRVDPEKDNWCVERGAEIGWATGNAGLSGSKVREVSEEVTFDDLSCAPQDTAKAKRKPTGVLIWCYQVRTPVVTVFCSAMDIPVVVANGNPGG